ncbi:hypothetical protein F2981_10595 [Sinorhizobium meliloti]|nr:hypothetical protein [Sinorhizobium meliloti]
MVWSGVRKSACAFPPASRSDFLDSITFMILGRRLFRVENRHGEMGIYLRCGRGRRGRGRPRPAGRQGG